MPRSQHLHHPGSAAWPLNRPSACRRTVALSGLFLLLLGVIGTLTMVSVEPVKGEERGGLNKRQFQLGGILGGAFRGVIDRPTPAADWELKVDPSPDQTASHPSLGIIFQLTTSQKGAMSTSLPADFGQTRPDANSKSDQYSNDDKSHLLDALADAVKYVLRESPSSVSTGSDNRRETFVSDLIGDKWIWPRPAAAPPSNPSLAASHQPVFSTLPQTIARADVIAKNDVERPTQIPESGSASPFGFLGSSFESNLRLWALSERATPQGAGEDPPGDDSSLLSCLARIAAEIYDIDPAAAARLIDAALQALHVNSSAIASVVPKVAQQASVTPADMLPLILPAVSKAMGGKVQQLSRSGPRDKVGLLNDVLSQGTNIINNLGRTAGGLVDPALQSVMNQVAGIVSAAANYLNEPLCAVNQILDGVTHEVVVPCNATSAVPVATSQFSSPLGVATSIVEQVSKTVVTIVLPSAYTSSETETPAPNPATATSGNTGTGGENGTPTSSAASPVEPCLACPCEQCSASKCLASSPSGTGGSQPPDPAVGPCPGRGFKCADCPDGWFCPPQETPAQPAPCGRGWPCYHCSSGWFCDSQGSSTQGISNVPTQTSTGVGSATQTLDSLAPGWKYLGCFQDAISRTVTGGKPIDYLRGDMSRDVCINHCGTRGYRYAGTESGKECWCGGAIRNDAVRLPEAQCTTPCQGTQGTCGGTWAVSVFACLPESEPPVPPVNKSPYGAGAGAGAGAISRLLASFQAGEGPTRDFGMRFDIGGP